MVSVQGICGENDGSFLYRSCILGDMDPAIY